MIDEIVSLPESVALGIKQFIKDKGLKSQPLLRVGIVFIFWTERNFFVQTCTWTELFQIYPDSINLENLKMIFFSYSILLVIYFWF